MSAAGKAGRLALPSLLPLLLALTCATLALLAAVPAHADSCPNAAYRTGLAAALPDCRGYELVSPADKNGGDVMPNTAHTRAAADGSAVAFDSLTGFGDVNGITLGSEYMAVRTGLPGTQGWLTHGITPTQAPLTLFHVFFSRDPNYEGEMSADLAYGVYRSALPLTNAPNVASVGNLYLRDDLRAPGLGSYQLISDSLTSQATNLTQKPFFAAASTDFSHVLFESPLDLVANATGGATKLYEWADGTLRLAGILPDGSPAQSSQAGVGVSPGSYAPHMVSADGSRVLFQAPADLNVFSPSGNVYMRTDGTTTVKLNASEKTTPETPQGASLWTASADGSRVFFISNEGLVNGDDGGTADLYMYDTSAPAGHHLTLISKDTNNSEVHAVLGVVGASADGHYVYYTDAGQLVPGEPQTGPLPGLYLWHDGTVTFIGTFDISGDARLDSLDTSWLFPERMDTARVSADGTSVLFMTHSDAGFKGRFGFAGYDHGTTCTTDGGAGGACRELYVYNDTRQTLQCASCIPSGATATADAMTAVVENSSNTANTSHLSHALSDDGRYVFFSTREALVPQDVNGKWDAYEFDTETGTVHLLSSGTSPDDSWLLDASASGSDAFFVTRQELTGWDTDDSYDLYDARIGGGLPDPVTTPACSGESCRSPLSTPPPFGPAAAQRNHPGGNLTLRRPAAKPKPKPKPRCHHGQLRRRIHGRLRCVRAPQHAKRKRG